MSSLSVNVIVRRSRRLAPMVLVVGVAFAAVGCGGRGSDGVELAQSGPAVAVPEAEAPGSSELLWESSASDVEFWEKHRIVGDEVEGYRDINRMKTSATAVVLGRVDAVTSGREVREAGVPRSAVRYPGLLFKVERVLHGDLPVGPDARGRILVESIAGSVAGSKAPQGAAVLFLRYKGEAYGGGHTGAPEEVVAADKRAYRWVSSEGVFIQKNGKAYNPVAERPEADAGVKAGQTPTGVPHHHELNTMVSSLENESLSALVQKVERSG